MDIPKKERGRAVEVTPAGPNITTTWREIETRGGKTLTIALEKMNASLNTSIKHSRITEWEQATKGKQPGREVIGYMVGKVLPVLLIEAGLSKIEAAKILAKVQTVKNT